MSNKKGLLTGFILVLGLQLRAQYNAKYVETYSQRVGDETYSVVKMSLSDNHIKVKYFAGKDYNGISVYQRFLEWSRNKNIVACSSGTYMDECDAAIAKPVGLCIDNGTLVNNSIKDNLDGLAIVYATGRIATTDLKVGELSITNGDGIKETLNIRNAFQRNKFIKWAKENSATVFQTHLFCFKNKLQVFANASIKKQERRFLAVGTDEDGILRHIIVNLSAGNTIYDASVKAVNFLKKDGIEEISFLINLDTGCQDVFQVLTPTGTVDSRKGFYGKAPISKGTNLIVYYYE